MKFCLILCSHSNWCILVLTCVSLCLVISVHMCLLHKAMNFLKTEALYRKLNLKTIYKGCSEFSISRIFKNRCFDRDMCRDKRLTWMTLSRLPDLKVCFKRHSLKDKIRKHLFGYPKYKVISFSLSHLIGSFAKSTFRF